MARRTAVEAVIESTTTGRPGVFGEVRVESSRLPVAGAFAGISAGDAAAANLVRKAVAALERGDAERAARTVARAVRLPYDAHEEWWPALQAVHTELHDTVADAVEAAPLGDPSWLDAALDVLTGLEESGDAVARAELREVLRVIRLDYRLGGRENRRIDAALRARAQRVTLVADQGPDLPEQERERLVVAVLRAVTLLRLRLSGT